MADAVDLDALDIKEQFLTLCQAYTQELPQKIALIEEIWQHVPKAADGHAALLDLHRLTHKLAGSGATFGFTALGDMAHTLEAFLGAIIDRGRPLTSEQQQQIAALITALRDVAIDCKPTIAPLPVQSQTSQRLPQFELNERLIFLVEDDPDQAQAMRLQVSYFGYTVRVFSQLTGLREAVATTPPAAILMDIMFCEGGLAGIEAIAAIQQERQQHFPTAKPIPVLFMSVRDDLIARIQAVRAQGEAYFTKPIDIGQLIDKLDMLVSHQMPEPYRVLIVEDDSTLAAYYALSLQQAGILSIIVTDAMEIMQPLVEFKPDLILMDVYMSGCNGLELAAVIRQQEAYISIPITFLSTETNLDKQMDAMSMGGDDFLTKPIHPNHLISAVKTRVQRSRVLRSFMVRDSLTGLFNHTKIKEQLSIEVKRSERQGTGFSFAMIDIDNFKQVNDTYGHLAGDRVIKSLSRLLKQRLRKTDFIGRYGGEEFAVILPGTDSLIALKVLEEIRVGFSQVRQQFGGTEFFVTFSCGIAAFPHFQDTTRLNDAADRALYRAKHQGRNQTILAKD